MFLMWLVVLSQKVFSWITFIVNGIIPFSMLIFMNGVIVQTVRESRNMFGTAPKVSNKYILDIHQGIATRQRTMKSAENPTNHHVAISYLVIFSSSYSHLHKVHLFDTCEE